MAKVISYLLLLLGLLLVGGCAEVNVEVNGQPLRFAYAVHLWSEDDNDILNEMIDDFGQLANATIVLEPAATVSKSLKEQLSAGLGPDIIIGLNYAEMVELAEANLLYNLNTFNVNLEAYEPEQIETLTTNGKLYGLPFMASTSVLFYNRARADSAPTSLNALAEVAAEGQVVAIPLNFEQAFWGLTAFDGKLFSPEGQPQATPEKYAEWFRWLTRMQNQAGVIIDDNLELLINKFNKGEVSYLIAPIDTLPQLAQALGEDTIGVAPLPGVAYIPDPRRPESTWIRQAAPLLSLEVIAFSKAASQRKVELGLELAEFLNNPTVQRKLILAGLPRAPSNRQIFIKSELSEVGNAITRQSRNSVIIPLNRLAQFQQFSREADKIYIGLLAGGVSAEAAADQMTALLNETFEAQ